MANRILSTDPLTPQQLIRYWAKVEVRGSDDCWMWQATKIPDGYGMFRVSSEVIPAHRIAFFIRHGWWPEVVRHACDHPACCNVTHLLAGSHADNSRDRDTRERRILTLRRADAETIRQRVAAGESCRTLASTYRISLRHTQKIVKGDRWRHH